MNTIVAIRGYYERFLELIVVLLVLGLALIIVVGFGSRLIGEPFSWYDEVASVGLAWLTYYGAALAAVKGAHISCPNLVNVMPPILRVPTAILAEILIIGFFVLLAWTGLQVVLILEGSTLISLPEVSLQLTQSVIPIGSVLFIIAELLRLPETLARAASTEGTFATDYELEEVLADTDPDSDNDQVKGTINVEGERTWR